MELAYRIRRPLANTDSRPPLLILLHGKGSNEEDLFALAKYFDPRFLVLSLRAPIQITPGSYQWFHSELTPEGWVINKNDAEQSRIILIQAIHDSVMAFGADPRQIFLLGFSQGAMMSYTIALTAPHKISGIVAISGRVLPELASLAAPAEALKHLKVLIQHGNQDTRVTIEHSYAARDLLAALSVMMGFREYPVEHTISKDMLTDAVAFLTTQLDPVETIEPKPALH